MKNKNLLFIVTLLVLVQVGLLALVLFAPDRTELAPLGRNDLFELSETVPPELLPASPTVHHAYFSDSDFYETAYATALPDEFTDREPVYGGILPHHLVAKDKIAAYLRQLEQFPYETVVLIGPNRFEAASAEVISTTGAWQTPFGVLAPDLRLATALVAAGQMVLDEEPFAREQAISGLVGFVKKSFPQVRLLPIILSSDIPTTTVAQVAESIFAHVDPAKTLVLASVDFSHYQRPEVAAFHDEKSRAVIASFDLERVYELEIDSAPSVYALLKYLELSQAQATDLVYHTNSRDYLEATDEPSTSHMFFRFSAGAASRQPFVNMLFFGDLMLDRHVREKIERSGRGLDLLLSDLAGPENRFFAGIDLISANLEGAVTNGGAHYPPEMGFDFAFDPELVRELGKYNFNYFNLANNHFTDQGERGIIETRENLTALKFGYFGCRDGEIADCSSIVVERGGIKIGLLGLSLVYSRLDEAVLRQKIADSRRACDLLLVNVHWGVEYDHQYNRRQSDLAHLMIDAGADLIVGHHPHVIQGVEVYKNKAIFYSLGNFIFDQYFSQATQEGLALGIDYDADIIRFNIFPLTSSSGAVKLMNTDQRESLLEKMVTWSNLEYIAERSLREGVLILNNE